MTKMKRLIVYLAPLAALLCLPLVTLAMAPSAPSNLVVSAVDGTGTSNAGVTLTWQNNDNSQSAFQIEKSTNGGSYQVVGTVDPAANTVKVSQTSLSPNTLYWFRISARNSLGEYSTYSATATNTYSGAAMPSLTVNAASAGKLGLIINENSNPSNTRYAIKNISTGRYLLVDGTMSGDSTAVFYTAAQWNGWAQNLDVNTSYSFDIVAKNEAGLITSASAATPSQLPGPVTPSDPYNLTTSINSGSSVTVSWSGNMNSYLVRDVNTGVTSQWLTNTHSYTFNSLTCNSGHSFTVQGRSANGTLGNVVGPVTSQTGSCTAPSLPASCPVLNSGDMIKVSGMPAIYVLDSRNEVLYFPSGDEFKSWNSDETYTGYYVNITQACFDALKVPDTYPAAVNFRPGSYMVLKDSSNQLYAVLPGNTLAKISSSAASSLYGNYQAKVISTVFWQQYTNRSQDITYSLAHEGMLLSLNNKIWYVDANSVIREVTTNGFSANRFKTASVRTGVQSMIDGFTTGQPIVGYEAGLSNRTSE